MIIIRNKSSSVAFNKVWDNYSYLKESNKQYLLTLNAGCKMVIIKIKDLDLLLLKFVVIIPI